METDGASRRSLEALMAEEPSSYDVFTEASGPEGSLPLTPEILRTWPSGHVFGLSQDVGMGWSPTQLGGPSVLILSTQGGLADDQGAPIALGYHTGHFEVSRMVGAAARRLGQHGARPYAGFVSDPCDGRSQGTAAMYDSLPFRNDAATVMRRLIRSLPRRRAVMGIATCDKGLPATMMALASLGDLPGILVPGGTSLLAESGEDAGKVQTIGARYAQGEISLAYAAEVGCSSCASPGGGCQFLGTAATAQVVAEALGMALPHSALMPSGQAIWLSLAEHSAEALIRLIASGVGMSQILTESAVKNAMTVFSAFGGSTNLLLHLPAVVFAAGLAIPSLEDWKSVNRETPRLVSVLPNGPINHPTARVFLAGGVPEVMLHLRRLGLLETGAKTVSGHSLDEVLDWWQDSERRFQLRKRLIEHDHIDPDDVIMSPDRAKARGMTPTLTFPTGNLAPQGSVIKSTAIDPQCLDDDGIYRHSGPAKVFVTEASAIAAIKTGAIEPGDVVVLMGRGPAGSGMEETYQLTSALRYLSWGKHVALLTDARFSGVSTGACVGHISPDALSGGPIAKVRDGDWIAITVDPLRLEGAIDWVGVGEERLTGASADRVLAQREPDPRLGPDPDLPDDTRLWAALQGVSGGIWNGAIYDVDRILAVLEAGKKALGV